MDNSGDQSGLGFAHVAMALKGVRRTGWLDRGVDPAIVESVADHSWSVALLAWLLAAGDASLDADKVLRMALVHDLAEAITGDLTPYDGNDTSERDWAFLNQRHERSPEMARARHEAEEAAIARIASSLPDMAAAELRGLWAEYDSRVSREACFVKEVDRLEAFLQSLRYLSTNPGLPVDSFRRDVEAELTHPALIRLRGEAAADKSLD